LVYFSYLGMVNGRIVHTAPIVQVLDWVHDVKDDRRIDSHDDGLWLTAAWGMGDCR